jgi:putative copper resistance protein D
MSLYLINVSVHILAALLWLGGMFFFALVGAPVIRKVPSPELRTQLFKQLGEQFRVVGWISIATLLVTGVLNLHFRGFLSPALLTSSSFCNRVLVKH